MEPVGTKPAMTFDMSFAIPDPPTVHKALLDECQWMSYNLSRFIPDLQHTEHITSNNAGSSKCDPERRLIDECHL